MKDKILDIFKNSNGRKLDPIDVVKKLNKEYKVNDLKEVIDILYELVNEGEIVSSKKNTFKLVTNEFIKSKVEKVQSGNGYLLLDTGDIFIDKKNMLDACDGDIVLCETFKRFGKTEARIKRVIERNLPIGEIIVSNGVTCVKLLKEYPLNVVLLPNKSISVVDGEIVKVKSVKEDKNNIYVKVIEKIGHKNSPDIDTLKVMSELGVPIGFSENTKEEVKLIPNVVKRSDYTNRIDLTNEELFTIDGVDTKDIDDAVGLKILDNGNYLLRVSIADVSNYVKFNSSIFNNAYNKGNSTYMADKVEPMLPIELSNGICSLNENEVRLSITTEMEIDRNGNFVSKNIYPSVIKSRKKMNYDSVNIILDGGHVSGYEEYETTLKNMLELSKILKKSKYERGEISFISDEIKLIMDENGKLKSIKKFKDGLGERIIEDFMIASNETSIELLTSKCDYGIFRVHGRPSPKKIEEFINFVSTLGYTLTGKYDYSNISNKDIQRILNDLKGVKDEELLNRKLLRSMQKAIYSTTNIGHFGLGSKMYTHETSPIRRFSDLILHYMIKIVIFKWDMGISLNELVNGLSEMCEHVSMTERRSDECEYQVNDMKIAEYMESHIGEEYIARVSDLLEKGFFVETEDYIEGFVSLDTIKDYYTLSDNKLFYYNRKKQIALTMGDKIKVRCISASKETKHVDFMLVEKL